MVIWLTGLSGSGKSTIAGILEEKLINDGVLCFVLDGDNLRSRLNKDLGFDDESRRENIRRAGEVARLLADAGVVVITAFISPFRKERSLVRKIVGSKRFNEIYIRCPLQICEKRDVKGLYKKARAGKITRFTGIDSPYEIPESPDLVIDSNKISAEKSAEKIFIYIKDKLEI